MTVEKTKIINKEKCDRLINSIYGDMKKLNYLHKVMYNTYKEYNGLDKVINLDDFKGECILKIYKSLDLYDETKSALMSFCITCIKSTALQTLRKSRATKNKLYNDDNVISLEAEIYDTEDCKFSDLIEGRDDEYFIDEFKKEVEEAFTHLTERERQTLFLKMQGYKTSEIAEILHLQPNNVTNRISKARIKLKKYLNVK